MSLIDTAIDYIHRIRFGSYFHIHGHELMRTIFEILLLLFY